MSWDTLIMTALSKDNHSYFSSDEESERENVTSATDRAFAREACFYCRNSSSYVLWTAQGIDGNQRNYWCAFQIWIDSHGDSLHRMRDYRLLSGLRHKGRWTWRVSLLRGLNSDSKQTAALYLSTLKMLGQWKSFLFHWTVKSQEKHRGNKSR